MKTIAIVGAGLIGRLAALKLALQGYQVNLFDQDTRAGKNSTAYAAGGLLAPLSEALKCEANMVAMGIAAVKAWPKLLTLLKQPVFFQQAGTLVLTHEQDKGDYLRFSQHLTQHFSGENFNFLDRAAITELEPELAHKFHQGLFLPDEAQLDNRQLMHALAEQLLLLKVNWQTETVITNIGQGFVCAGKTTYLADLVLDCRGVAANQQQTVEIALQDLRAVRGELFHLYAPEVNITRPIRLTHPRYQLYIAPKAQQRFIIGATEIEAASLKPMTVRSSLELLSAAYSIHGGFAEAEILEQVSHCRPALPDNQPKIFVKPQLISVNGLFRHGFLLAPVVLNHLLAVVEQQLNNTQELKAFAFPELIKYTSTREVCA